MKKKIATCLGVLLLCGTAWAGQQIAFGNYTVESDPAVSVYAEFSFPWEPNRLWVNGILYLWDEELEMYTNAASGDSWEFHSWTGNATFWDAPLPPMQGPPAPHTAPYNADE